MHVADHQWDLSRQHHLFQLQHLPEQLHQLWLHLDTDHLRGLHRNSLQLHHAHQLHDLRIRSWLHLVHHAGLHRHGLLVQQSLNQRFLCQASGLHLDGQHRVLQRQCIQLPVQDDGGRLRHRDRLHLERHKLLGNREQLLPRSSDRLRDRNGMLLVRERHLRRHTRCVQHRSQQHRLSVGQRLHVVQRLVHRHAQPLHDAHANPVHQQQRLLVVRRHRHVLGGDAL